MMLHEIPPYYLVPEELAGTHARLVNWARWSRDRPAVVRCYSLEGRYRPELLRSLHLRCSCGCTLPDSESARNHKR